MKKIAIIAGLISLGCCLSTAAGDFHPSPSNLAGPYDLLGITGAAEDTVIPGKIVLDVSIQRSRDTLDGHTSALVYSAEVPFGESVSLKVDNLCEMWKLSSGKTGSDMGEVAAVTKFLILKETNSLPALAIKLGLKSAAGDGHSLRYTDSMGVLIGLMAARDFHLGGTNSVRTVRAFVELGLAVWDNGIDTYGFNEQDDATKFAAAVQFQPGEHVVVRGGIHGLNGWRHNGDTPVSANAAVEYTVSERASAYMNVDIGLCKDADDYIVGGGLKVRFGKGG